MKRIVLLAALCMAISGMSFAQTAQELLKERQELAKATKAELNKKASDTARKEAKKFEKEGWQVTPGALPLDRQLDRAYMMQMAEFDEDMFPKYIIGEAMSIGEHYDAAKMQAQELAKLNLAAQIQTEITALVENSLANEQLSEGQAESISKSVMAGKNLISQSIGRTITLVEAYREKKGGNKEVLLRIAYSGNMAKKVAKKVIKEDLKQKGDELHEQLDELLGW
ncbi:MAG: hypothetical protein IJ511_10985 [Bacteroides sp.]|nr:hypothetical protein [Bacteroides sp.]